MRSQFLVRVQIAQYMKLSQTYFTLVLRFIVKRLVLAQTIFCVELLTTHITLVNRIKVILQVPVQTIRLVELLPTFRTNVLRLVVEGHVVGQVRVRPEKPPHPRANGTLQRLLGTVGLPVGVQVAFAGETSAAILTLERFLPGVGPHVVSELGLAPVVLEAHLALVVGFVQALVLVQSVSQREFLSARGTLELFRLLLFGLSAII